MKKDMTLSEAKDIVLEESRGNYDTQVPANEISFLNLQQIEIGNFTANLDYTAQTQICNKIKVPYSYLKKCEANLQAKNLNYWIEKLENKILFLRMNSLDHPRVRAIFTNRYKPLDNLEVIKKIGAETGRDDIPVTLSLDKLMMKIDMLDMEGRFDLQGEHQSGLSIVNSEIGYSSAKIAAFILRLICTNGMVVRDNTGMSSRRHVTENLMDNFIKPFLNNGYKDTIEKAKNNLKYSIESKVASPISTIGSFSERFKLNAIEHSAAVWGWEQDPGENMFSIVQAFTKGEQYPELNVLQQNNMQTIGGKILGLVAAK